MITLREDKFIFDIPLKDIINIDTKANILECFQMLQAYAPKSYRKYQLAEIYDRFFHEQPDWVLEYVPEEEYSLLERLLDMPQTAYIEYPRNKIRFLFIQKCYLVFTYEYKDTWHIYMGDYVRNILKEAMCKRKQRQNTSDSIIPLNEDYEQDIFTRRAIDTDCSLISILMDAEIENIKELLESKDYQEASLNYMQLLKSMCGHFVSDEHYNYFDDMYCPDYSASELTRLFNQYHAEGKLPQTVVDYLNIAWKEIKEEEAYCDYGIPSEEWKS